MQALLTEKPEYANPWVAAALGLSTGMRTAVCNLLALNPDSYEVIKDVSKSLDEPFSADGDCDGDGASNLDEYVYVVAAGGDIEDFMMEAGEDNPLWPGNPALPAAGAASLALTCLLIVLSIKHRLCGRG
jgi:hypothetical protein